MTKVLTGVSNNVAKNIDKIKVWANSFKKHTNGDVVLIAANTTNEDRNVLRLNGIKFHEVTTDSTLTINDSRLNHIADWIETSQYDLFMVTDVFDVCFQADPFEMFDHHGFYAASEGVLHCEEPWNMDVMRKAFPDYAEFIKLHEVVCSGVMGGRKNDLVNILRMQQKLVNEALNGHDIRDQAALNILIYKNLIANYRIFKPHEGWAIHCSLSGPTFQHIEWGLGKTIDRRYGLPHLEADKLVDSKGKIYKIAHQYNRIPEWNEKIIAQYV